MDRGIQYPGSIPLDTDPLLISQNTMKALGALTQAAFGTSTFADGLICTQTTVPSMSVTIGQGWIGALATVEPTAFGSLASDATPLMKMGINMLATTTSAMTAPVTAGQSIVYLVQAAFQEVDGSPVVLPYYNSTTPAIPYTGPANSGTAQNTKRAQTVTLQLKQGTAATTGSQTTPAPDSGFTGLYAITIANGATTVVNANIAVVPGAPFLNPTAGQGLKRGRLLAVRVFTSSGTYIPSVGATQAEVECLGGGAAGGGVGVTGAGFCGAAGGGSAGAYAKKLVTSLSSQTITIGAAGTGGSGTGGVGGTTSFGAILIAPGGVGGTSGVGNNTAAVSSPSGATPTAPTGGDVGSIGTAGGAGLCLSASAAISGAGGSSVYGSGGGPAGANATVATTGAAASGYGSGGGGAVAVASGTTTAGGAGSPGMIIITEYS